MTILYSNGCSFTANLNISRWQRYPLLIGKHFNWTVVDRAIPGSCNNKIIRCAMRDCIALLKQNKPIVALIQLTYKERFEYAGTPMGANNWKYGEFNTGLECIPASDQFESVKAGDSDNWPDEIKQYAKMHAALQKPNALNAELFARVIGLVSFFKSNNIQYLIYAGPSFKDELIADDPFYQYLINDPNVLNFLNFDMLTLTGGQTHPNIDGMQKIADYFINLLAAQE